MKYTEYLLDQVRANGSPQMNTSAFEKIIKIVYLEARCDQMKGVMTSVRNTDMPHLFDVRHFNLNKKLTLLTENLDPKSVFETILKNSHE